MDHSWPFARSRHLSIFLIIDSVEFWQFPDYRYGVIEPGLQLFVILLLALTALGIPGQILKGVRRGWLLWGWVASLLVVYYALPIVDFAYFGLSSSTIGRVTVAPIVPQDVIVGITVQSAQLTYALSLVYILAGTDIAEWGEAISVSAVRLVTPQRLRRVHPIIVCAVFVLVALAILWDTINRLGFEHSVRQLPVSTVPSLFVALGVILLAIVFVRMAKITLRWPSELPTRALFSSALFLFCAIALISLLQNVLQSINDETSRSVVAKGGIVRAVLALSVLVFSVIALRRAQSSGDSVSESKWLMVTLTALVILPHFALPVLSNLGVRVPPSNETSIFTALQLLVSIGAIGYALYVAVRTRFAQMALARFTSSLLLVLSLEVLHWALDAREVSVEHRAR